ncbi:LysR family transcriptional regulator [Nitratireductor sp. XY-223]|uniref:LysR family transcriptional regulator n=1 Tax=Nitratireductor sp. XY-223 TaxID=2561926 RepID=UPI00145B3220|nr:LysR family transcriptional regulator [Nitratireductor sp. XY-223]
MITQAAKVFEMVARYGSIRKAADRVNASPSAVNRQILNLEREFGVPLFERHARGMRLTQAGQTVLEQIRDWQRNDQHLRSTVERLAGSSGVQIRVGIMECFAAEFLPDVFAAFRDQYPGATLNASVGGTADIARLLMAGSIDLAILFNLPPDHGLKVVHEVQVPLGAAMSPDHALASNGELHLEDLCDHPLALADNSLTIGPVVSALLERLRIPVKRAVTTNSLSALKSFAKRGDGVSILTSADVYQEVRERQLKFVQIERARMFELLSVAVRDDKAISRGSQLMVTLVCEAIDQVCGGQTLRQH